MVYYIGMTDNRGKTTGNVDGGRLNSFTQKYKTGTKVAIGVGIFLLVVGIVGAVMSSIERNRDYTIDLDDEYNFACNLAYDDKQNTFSCAERTIEGTFTSYSTDELHLSLNEVDIQGDSFSVPLPIVQIDASNFETDNYSSDNIIDKYGRTTFYASIYNTYLKEDVLNKTITVNWQFSDYDLAMINAKNVVWKEAEAKKRAEEEARKAAEEQRKAAEAAAAAQQKAQEEAARRAAQSTQRYTTTTSNSTANTGGSSSSYTPPVQSSGGNVYYPNRDAVRAAGKAPLYRGQPGYSAKLDRDKDGIACE